MNNFVYHNPVKIIFGKNTFSNLNSLIADRKKIMLVYGGGSIKKNGVYDQILNTLIDKKIVEFGGVEANPDYTTLMKAVELCKNEEVDFLLAAGGGSVIDGTKFIAAAFYYDTGDPWDLLTKKSEISVKRALPIGTILTLAGTGSEMNGFAVISRRENEEKLSFGSPLLYPVFSILDPETTYSLSDYNICNGIVDSFIHVCEQYLTYKVDSPLQDKQAEAILRTLIGEGTRYLNEPMNYENRANLMWCSTQALNGLISCGVPQDWVTHNIGHEITALYGLDHARSLAAVFPSVIKHQKENKFDKVVQFGKMVWNIIGDKDFVFNETLIRTLEFFKSLGFYTTLGEYGIGSENFEKISLQIMKRGRKFGEKKNIGYKEIVEILELCLK